MNAVLSRLERSVVGDLPARQPAARQAAAPVARDRGLSVTLTGVRKSFGAHEVLHGLDLHVPAGQFLAVVGRSGGGKTTLMRLIAGLDAPTAGHLRLDEREVTGLQPDVRLMFQDARLVPWKRVIDNVGIARGLNWRTHAEAALADVGLATRARDWPAVLSGGQRQRVALARALVSHPGVLLLDEPFGALDAMTRAEMHTLLLRIRAARGFTALLITHDVAEAVALADRVIVLRQGGISLDVDIPQDRPRRHGDPALAAIEERILAAV
ncbi:ATP-binding cassette domain-containing protein [Zavarzinia compransoris]|uniref:Aliphatic sulfonate ABC transporter ATP-binding protein n=1 Tax=Zavarzinia compransoris TaxID=1264899 RepID=A0A317E289_9PROT|nr:ATP-binding cassette domain-containing protein [Zavarzinia compransoris]PWR20701.1 aliphatic sulfonate ABC transporter ATP-binding protein [Zavarzinia compransoris]TDP44474.1 sulfonate transport system ATP-binding protein [Zavarzinia compransoris]